MNFGRRLNYEQGQAARLPVWVKEKNFFSLKKSPRLFETIAPDYASANRTNPVRNWNRIETYMIGDESVRGIVDGKFAGHKRSFQLVFTENQTHERLD